MALSRTTPRYFRPQPMGNTPAFMLVHASRLCAVYCVTNPRHRLCYGCGLRLVSHRKSERLPPTESGVVTHRFVPVVVKRQLGPLHSRSHANPGVRRCHLVRGRSGSASDCPNNRHHRSTSGKSLRLARSAAQTSAFASKGCSEVDSAGSHPKNCARPCSRRPSPITDLRGLKRRVDGVQSMLTLRSAILSGEPPEQ